jgi:D-alanyl-D-alanine carboxypeptidase
VPLSASSRSYGDHRVRSVVVAMAVALGVLAWSAAAVAAPPRAALTDASLAAQVKAMQAQAERVGVKLAAGAQKWEQGRARLDVRIQQAMAAQRLVETQQQDLQEAQARVNAVARHAYTHPAPDTWMMALSVDPHALSESLDNIRILRKLGATRQDAVTQLLNQRAGIAARATNAERLSRQAQQEQVQLDADLDALRAEAADSLAQLEAAQARLAQLRAQEAARRAAALHRQQAMGTCSATADGLYANGFLPPEMLCPLRTAPGQQLAAQAAATFDQMSEAYRASTGNYLCVTDSYRPYEDQVRLFSEKPSLAATPGRSNHGWGLAVDFCGGIERAGTAASLWMQSNASLFGWVHPAWAETTGSKPEAWHWEYAGR